MFCVCVCVCVSGGIFSVQHSTEYQPPYRGSHSPLPCMQVTQCAGPATHVRIHRARTRHVDGRDRGEGAGQPCIPESGEGHDS